MKLNVYAIHQCIYRIDDAKIVTGDPKTFTGKKPTDILGIQNKDGTVTVSAETWRRIQFFAEILSAVDMTISDEMINKVLGGKGL